MKALKTLAAVILIIASCQTELQAQSKKEILENAIHNYLRRNFNTGTLIFTYVGNVEIKGGSDKGFGNYYLEGEFDYKNLADIQVRRKFRVSVSSFLGDYSIKYFHFYAYDMEKWVWVKL